MPSLELNIPRCGGQRDRGFLWGDMSPNPLSAPEVPKSQQDEGIIPMGSCSTLGLSRGGFLWGDRAPNPLIALEVPKIPAGLKNNSQEELHHPGAGTGTMGVISFGISEPQTPSGALEVPKSRRDGARSPERAAAAPACARAGGQGGAPGEQNSFSICEEPSER